MGLETNQATVAASTTKTMQRIKRVRNSSRCSRKDIWPPRSSSRVSFFLSDLINRRAISGGADLRCVQESFRATRVLRKPPAFPLQELEMDRAVGLIPDLRVSPKAR